jgi:2-keto-4-pentenoate hydratase/2-oxohepta-3-ene-1,7-dioic acid hydratase in catechol pathway
MHLATFELRKKSLVGCKIGEDLCQLDRAYTQTFRDPPAPRLTNMRSLLEKGDEALEKTRALVAGIQDTLSNAGGREELLRRGILHKIANVRIVSPIPDPEKIICVGRNYMDHCLEQNKPVPEKPILFSKFRTAIIGPGDEIVRPRATERLDFEGELAFVIGKEGRNIPIDRSMEYVAGYTILNDVSARDLQFSDGQWLRGKSCDTFAPMGPFLATKDEIEDPHNLSIKVTVNGDTMQDSNTGSMIFRIPDLVSFISATMTLSPGDVVATGTPAGVGVFRDPPVFLKAGDTVAIEIEGLGSLTNVVVDEER